ncbi:hypothetical protein ALISP_1193 [Alicycliphilus sp. B1]|nr:hypothetical protein ALISP_1193 [Alicycliphilus sp. B1]
MLDFAFRYGHNARLRVKMREVSAQWKRCEMVRGVDDGPKTDWLLAALEKTLGLSGCAGASWEY